MKKRINNYTRIQKFLWLIAGSEISALEKCPNEYNRHANIGLMILITSFFAALTSFIAARTFVKDGFLGALFFSIIWALVIFSLDRSMVNSIKKLPNFNEKFNWGYFWPRLVLAFILSFFMSIPLDHIVFEERIKYQMSQNVNSDWQERQIDLKHGYDTKNDSLIFARQEKKSLELTEQINSGCLLCPNYDYTNSKSLAEQISKKLPALQKVRIKANEKYSAYFNKLQSNQTAIGEELISPKKVIGDPTLAFYKREMQLAQNNYKKADFEAKQLYLKASKSCQDWRDNALLEKKKLDTLTGNTLSRLDSNIIAIAEESSDYKTMIGSMQGFDTQFVTLFTMPNLGVQVLKWLIFLVLLVIEILPTYLKLKTPYGQYDRVMHAREVETELEIESNLRSLESSLNKIEDYRVKSEIDLNKRLIDQMVDIEEKLANEMLKEWEINARTQMNLDLDNSKIS